MHNIFILLLFYLAACGRLVSGSTHATVVEKPKLALPPATYLVHQRGQCLTIINQKLQLSPCSGNKNQQFKLRSDNAWVINQQCLAMSHQQVVTQPCQLPSPHRFGLGNKRFVYHQLDLCAQSSGEKVVWRECDKNQRKQDFEYY